MIKRFSEITINKRNIGENYPLYIIAEMSANHNGKIENAIFNSLFYKYIQ